jgi:uncharacterized protein (TIGR00369 family)
MDASMHIQNPHFERKVREIFDKAAFIKTLGIELAEIKPGRCSTSLQVQAMHLQQDAVVHAGVLATMADHTAGAAACSLVGDNEIVLTVEFKINFLRPALGKRLTCQARILRQGRQLIAAESEVFSIQNDEDHLIAKAMVTLAVVPPLTFANE